MVDGRQSPHDDASLLLHLLTMIILAWQTEDSNVAFERARE